MTTAHKPTWNSAQGSDEQGGSLRGVQSRMTSSKDLPAHKKLHYRQEGQNAPTETRSRNFREELEEKERRLKDKRKPDEIEEGDSKRRRIEPAKEEPKFNPLDRDDPDSSDDSSGSDSDDSDDSEEAELLKEFEKIQKEREAERQRLEEDRRAAEIQSTADGIMRGNPLLHSTGGEDYTLKKKWYDDVVFKHQSRSEPVKKQRFINDTTRNDFHRKFLSKYVK